MKALCINCSDSIAEVSLICGGEIFSESITSPHCEKLMPAVDRLLSQTKLSVKDLNTLSVVVGPGSFTGIRIAVATIKGIAVVNTKAKLVKISNFDLVSFNVPEKDYYVALESGNEDKYVALYKSNVCTKITTMKTSEIENLPFPVFALANQKEKLGLKNAHYVELESNTLAHLTEKKCAGQDYVSINELAPIYVKLSQAERERSAKILKGLQIVPADSVEQLLSIENECFSEDAWSEKIFADEIYLDNKYYFLAKYDGKNIGYMGFETNLYDMNLQKIAVLEDYRNCGVATALFNFSLEQKKKLSKDKYFLEVDTKNTSAINLYKKLGFKIISTRPRYYKNGDDCFVMQYDEVSSNN